MHVNMHSTSPTALTNKEPTAIEIYCQNLDFEIAVFCVTEQKNTTIDEKVGECSDITEEENM